MNLELLINLALLLLFINALFLAYFISLKKQEGQNASTKADAKSLEVVHDATKRAQNLLTEAEITSIHLTSQERLQSKELLRAYEHKLNTLLNELTHDLSHHSQKAEDTLQSMQERIEDKALEKIEKTAKTVEENMDKYVSSFNKSLVEKTSQTLEAEIDRVQKDLAEYKKQQMRHLDEQIVDIVTEVLQKTTSQALGVEQHTDLIFAALNEAKKNHVFEES